MIVKSKISGAMNDYLRTVYDIQIRMYPNTEIVVTKSSVKDFCIDTAESLSSRTLSGLKKAERKFDVSDYAVRDTLTCSLEGRKNNTRIGLSSLLGVVQYLQDNSLEEFEGMEGMSINHIDMTGNQNQRGFVNNRLYNLELCTDTENAIHRVVMDKLQDVVYPGKFFGVSALDKELIDTVRFKDIEEIKKYMDSIAWTGEIDRHGTIYMGKAGIKLRMWKNKWNIMKTDMELKKVRLS